MAMGELMIRRDHKVERNTANTENGLKAVQWCLATTSNERSQLRWIVGLAIGGAESRGGENQTAGCFRVFDVLQE